MELVIPKLEEYKYEQYLESDPDTMSYNAGYDVTYPGYHYDTGCIDFPQSKWKETYQKRIIENRFFAYIKVDDKYVGYVNYQYDKSENRYDCGILIEAKYRGLRYSKEALNLLVKEAYKNNIEYLYDTFEKDREGILDLFLSVGFEIIEEKTWKKFDKNVDGVVVRIKTRG